MEELENKVEVLTDAQVPAVTQSEMAKMFEDFSDYLCRIINLMVAADNAYGDRQGSEKLAEFKKQWSDFIQEIKNDGREVPAWCEDFRNIQRIINAILILFKLSLCIIQPKNAISFFAKTIAGSGIFRISK